MTHDAKLYFIHAVSPLHAGVGSGLDAINLPTARERWTGYPYLPGSSVKGVLREAAERLEQGGRLGKRDVHGAFGPPTDNAADARGGLVFSDASLLALPVRSLFGTFAWVTCPYVLARLLRDALEAGASAVVTALEALAQGGATLPAVATTSAAAPPAAGGALYLEELQLDAPTASAEVDVVAGWIGSVMWPAVARSPAAAFLVERFVVIPDDVFGFFTRTATEVRHRVPIDHNTGTAKASGPWTEEYLPAETLLHGLVIGRPTRYVDRPVGGAPAAAPVDVNAGATLATLATALTEGGSLRFGGKTTGGMGRAHMQVLP